MVMSICGGCCGSSLGLAFCRIIFRADFEMRYHISSKALLLDDMRQLVCDQLRPVGV
jgi:hypothetical protein